MANEQKTTKREQRAFLDALGVVNSTSISRDLDVEALDDIAMTLRGVLSRVDFARGDISTHTSNFVAMLNDKITNDDFYAHYVEHYNSLKSMCNERFFRIVGARHTSNEYITIDCENVVELVHHNNTLERATFTKRREYTLSVFDFQPMYDSSMFPHNDDPMNEGAQSYIEQCDVFAHCGASMHAIESIIGYKIEIDV